MGSDVPFPHYAIDVYLCIKPMYRTKAKSVQFFDCDSQLVFVRFSTGYSYSTYFLKYRRYWRYDENRGSVDEGYPRIFDVDWMGCAVGDLELEGSDGDVQEYFPFKTTTDDGTNSATNLRINIFMASCLLILLSLFQRQTL